MAGYPARHHARYSAAAGYRSGYDCLVGGLPSERAPDRRRFGAHRHYSIACSGGAAADRKALVPGWGARAPAQRWPNKAPKKPATLLSRFPLAGAGAGEAIGGLGTTEVPAAGPIGARPALAVPNPPGTPCKAHM